jgi:hypothetical protein
MRCRARLRAKRGGASSLSVASRPAQLKTSRPKGFTCYRRRWARRMPISRVSNRPVTTSTNIVNRAMSPTVLPPSVEPRVCNESGPYADSDAGVYRANALSPAPMKLVVESHPAAADDGDRRKRHRRRRCPLTHRARWYLVPLRWNARGSWVGAEAGDRTRMRLPSTVFETVASACSATSARTCSKSYRR